MPQTVAAKNDIASLKTTETLRAISLKPDYTTALHNLGYTYHVSGNLQEAERWYLEVLKHEPNHLQTCLRLAHLYREEKQGVKLANEHSKNSQ